MPLTRRAVLTVLGIWMFVAVAVGMLVAVRPPAAPSTGTPTTLTATWPATGMTHFALDGGDGEVTIGTTERDAIEVSVETTADSPSLHHETAGARLHARLAAPAMDPAVERWTIRVPARLGVRVAMHDGRIRVTGVAGGVDASATAGVGSDRGEIVVDVPTGALALRLSVGTIEATTGSAGHGRVNVRSGVGRARLSIGGREVVAPRWPGPGHHLQLDGPGPYPLDVHVTVGDATLTIR